MLSCLSDSATRTAGRTAGLQLDFQLGTMPAAGADKPEERLAAAAAAKAAIEELKQTPVRAMLHTVSCACDHRIRN